MHERSCLGAGSAAASPRHDEHTAVSAPWMPASQQAAQEAGLTSTVTTAKTSLKSSTVTSKEPVSLM